MVAGAGRDRRDLRRGEPAAADRGTLVASLGDPSDSHHGAAPEQRRHAYQRHDRGVSGLTFLTLPLEPADIATRLVHEASHHYFLALQRIAALHDGSDTTNYHSPIKERGRTIDMILFAFHAFGNGALFHRDLARRDSHFERIAGGTVPQAMAPLRTMHDYLQGSQALTSAGRTLWQPVAERLFR